MEEKPFVLCLDDEVAILNSLNRELRRDFNVFTANNYKDAIDIFKKNQEKFAIVISDIHMPDAYGISFLREIKNLSPEVVCIILSGQGMLSDVVAAINEKLVYKYILKPWMPNQILNTVKDAYKIKVQNSTMNTLSELMSKTSLDFQSIERTSKSLQSNSDLKLICEKLTKFKKLADIGMATTKIIHDFNNKLLILDMGLTYMHSMDQSSVPPNVLNSFDASLHEMHNMIEDLQSFLIGKNFALSLQKVDLREFLNICFEDAKYFFKKTVQFNFSIEENITLSIDTDKIKRVILNLAKNSSEAMDSGVFSIKGFQDDNNIFIEISDTGKGMSEQMTEKLFSQSISLKPNGLGVGLINVKEIIEQHGAIIEVNSEINKGSNFILKFKK